MTTVRKFPMNGYADTCTGYGNGADGTAEWHGTNEELGTGATDSLCKECRARLLIDCRPEPRVATTFICPGGCNGHTHGSRYYDCLCCYGD